LFRFNIFSIHNLHEQRGVLKFSEIGEFGFIDSIKGQFGVPTQGVIKGIGDDCAVMSAPQGRVLLFTSDMLVQDIHFMIEKIPFYQLGRKAIAVNLSDIAAMGGRPLVALISLAIPAETEVEAIHELYRGMGDICEQYNLFIGGGDTVASPDKLVINVSVIGDAKRNKVLYRSGAGPGEMIYLAGPVGDSAAGLKILANEIAPPAGMRDYFIKAHNDPAPLVETGKIIAASGLAGAMIDLSDGLLSDLGHICEESKVGALLFAEKIPISPELTMLASSLGFDPLELALSGGEDYQLLFTVPMEHEQGIGKLFKDHHLHPPYHIGETGQGPGIRMKKADGSLAELQPMGFNHFNRNKG
jgi:thiamine-monophosphate kinase